MRLLQRCSLSIMLALCALASQEAAAIPLFNGVDLTGWTELGGAGTYQVADGEIVGTSPPLGSANTFLVTQANFANFVLNLDFKIDAPAFNSGVQIRSQSLPSHNNGRVFGYQVEIDPSARAWSGGLYFEGGSPNRGAGWLDDLADNPAARAAFLLGQWNHFRVVANDRRIQTWINDVPAADFTDNHATGFLPSGFIGLQVHSVTSANPGPFEVRWRNIDLAEIVSSPVTLGIVVDPLTGAARLRNPTLQAISIETYSISSASSSLRPANGQWLSLADQAIAGWQEANPSTGDLSELNPFGDLSVSPGASYSLGVPFNPAGTRDLTFQYLDPADPEPTAGAVLYRHAADFDLDGDVDVHDLSAWRLGFGPSGAADADFDGDADGADLLAWQRQLGASIASATLAAASLPEPPAAIMIAALGLALAVERLTPRRVRRAVPGAAHPIRGAIGRKHRNSY